MSVCREGSTSVSRVTILPSTSGASAWGITDSSKDWMLFRRRNIARFMSGVISVARCGDCCNIWRLMLASCRLIW